MADTIEKCEWCGWWKEGMGVKSGRPCPSSSTGHSFYTEVITPIKVRRYNPHSCNGCGRSRDECLCRPEYNREEELEIAREADK